MPPLPDWLLMRMIASYSRPIPSGRSADTALPSQRACAFLRVETLLDRILMRTGERGENQVAAVGVARMHRHLVAPLDRSARSRDVGEIELGVDALREQFIASATMSTLPVRSPLPNSVPSTRSAPAISPSSAAATPVPRSLCGCREMMMLVAVGYVRPEPFDLVGVDVRRRHSTVAGRLRMIWSRGWAP